MTSTAPFGKDAEDYTTRLVVVPIWTSINVVDTVLMSLWLAEGKKPSFILPLLVIRTLFYAFQMAVVFRNTYYPRLNILNMWQYLSSDSLRGVLVLLILAWFYLVGSINVVFVVQLASLPGSNVHMFRAAVAFVVLSSVFWLTGFWLYTYTAFQMVVKGNKAYEMLPAQMKA